MLHGRHRWIAALMVVALGCAPPPVPDDGETSTATDTSESPDIQLDVQGGDAQTLDGVGQNAPPTLAITSPAPGALVDGAALTLSGTASDDGGADALEVRCDDAAGAGPLLGTTQPAAGGSWSLTVSLTPGEHTVRCQARDAAGAVAAASLTLRANSAPVAPGLSLLPSVPNTADDLVATVQGSGSDGDRPGRSLAASVRWRKDGAATAYAGTTLPASATTRGEVWTAEAVVVDPLGAEAVQSASVTIANAVPSTPALALQPAEPDLLDTVTCKVLVVSADADADELQLAWSWSIDGAVVPGATAHTLDLATLILPDGSRPKAGQVLRCSQTVSDGQGGGVTGSSSATALAGVTLCGTAADPCDLAANCTDTDTILPVCTCKDGYVGDGKSCTDVDECAATPGPCGANANCANTPGGYLCTCAPGFGAEVAGCVDLDECKLGSPCPAPSSCINLPGSFDCSCPDGGKGCFDAPPAIALVGPPSVQVAQYGSYVEQGALASDTADGDLSAKVVVTGKVAVDVVGSYVLTYAVTDSAGQTAAVNRTVVVVDTDECKLPASDPHAATCAADQLCANTDGAYTCVCKTGGSGASCGITVVDLVAGHLHACAVLSDGTMRCWGDNAQGQLGVPPCEGVGTDQTCASVLICDKSELPYVCKTDVLERSSTALVVQGISGASAVAAGEAFTCAIVAGGKVRCWGRAVEGQLGDGVTATQTFKPVDVAGLADVVQLVAGARHACARRSDGSVWCWGDNTFGQCGQNGAGTVPKPTALAGLAQAAAGDPVQALDAGAEHTCALHKSGKVRCWGRNSSGQLGIGNVQSGWLPQTVLDLDDAVAVAAGADFGCAVRKSGKVVCWGEGESGQLGDGKKFDTTKPVEVAGVDGAASVSAGGQHACAVQSGGTLRCWGKDLGGENPDGMTPFMTTTFPTATPIAKLSGVVAVSAGDAHTCVRLVGGKASCFGNNVHGQLGDGSARYASTPSSVLGVASATHVAAGQYHSLALEQDGTVRAWGNDGFGQLGEGATPGFRSLPTTATGLAGSKVIAAAGEHSCAIVANGSLYCWGDDKDGQAGGGGGGQIDAPAKVALPQAAVAVQAGLTWTCAQLADDTLRCWGSNNPGPFTDPTTIFSSKTPVEPKGIGPVKRFELGGAHGCAVPKTGGLRCWGFNYFGQLGDGSETPSADAVVVKGLPAGDPVALALGEYHTCAIAQNGGLWCWGANFAGQLGDGKVGWKEPKPLLVGGLPPVSAVAAGNDHTCAITTTGAVYCWGLNALGQVGDGAPAFSTPKPALVKDLVGATDLDLGDSHSCARQIGGKVFCWGFGVVGQLGNGACFDLCPPRPLLGLP